MSIRIIKSSDPSSDSAVAAVRDVLRAGQLTHGGVPGDVDLREVVRKTIDGVRRDGDARVIADTARLHGVQLAADKLRVPKDEILAAHEAADEDFLGLIRRVARNIQEYQESILIKAPPAIRRGGRTLSVRYTPIDRVAVYVPGGRAAYPSSMLMTVVPAQVAGVKQIVMVSPPDRELKTIIPMVLAVACELGIDEIYRVSGVAGLVAVAFGTESISPPVAKIVGPGSAYIAEAKRQLFGWVGIDSIAGPSEVLIIADASANAAYVAADLLAQAEHDPGSAVLVTPSDKLAAEVQSTIEAQIAAMDREKGARIDAIRTDLAEYSAIIVVPDIDAACEVANDFATEHLQIITEDNDAVLANIRNAGAVFLGSHTPVPVGDYHAGPSHVLPTGGTARFFGPLSCNDFRKASSVVQYSPDALAEDAADIIDFAKREGLTAHAEAVKIRQKDQ